MMDDPIAPDHDREEVKISKTTTYIDENGENVLAEELRKYILHRDEFSDIMSTKRDLYSWGANVEYTINEERIQNVLENDRNSDNPGGYQIVEYIKNIYDLKHRNNDLARANRGNLSRLYIAIKFAEKVNDSKIGKFIFRKDLKALDVPEEERW